jgi:hypothetical protein
VSGNLAERPSFVMGYQLMMADQILMGLFSVGILMSPSCLAINHSDLCDRVVGNIGYDASGSDCTLVSKALRG